MLRDTHTQRGKSLKKEVRVWGCLCNPRVHLQLIIYHWGISRTTFCATSDFQSGNTKLYIYAIKLVCLVSHVAPLVFNKTSLEREINAAKQVKGIRKIIK